MRGAGITLSRERGWTNDQCGADSWPCAVQESSPWLRRSLSTHYVLRHSWQLVPNTASSPPLEAADPTPPAPPPVSNTIQHQSQIKPLYIHCVSLTFRFLSEAIVAWLFSVSQWCAVCMCLRCPLRKQCIFLLLLQFVEFTRSGWHWMMHNGTPLHQTWSSPTCKSNYGCLWLGWGVLWPLSTVHCDTFNCSKVESHRRARLQITGSVPKTAVK